MRKISYLMALVLVLALGACGSSGGDDPSDNDTQSRSDVTGSDIQAQDVPKVDQVEEDEVQKECSPNLVIEFFGIQDGQTLDTTKNYPIQARIYNTQTQEMVQGETITFVAEGDGDGSFTEGEAVTNEYGVATVEFVAGETVDATYTLTAGNWCAGDVSIQVSTVPPEQGSITINVAVDADLTAKWPDLKLTVYLNNTIPMCGAFDYTKPTGASKQLSNGATFVEFPDAMANTGYVAAVVALNKQGLPVGGGCTESVMVLPDKAIEVDVQVGALSLNPVGNYEVTIHADMTSLLSNDWVDAGSTFQTLFEDAGNVIGQKIIDDLLIYFPEGFPEECGDVSAEIKGSIIIGLGTSYPPAEMDSVGAGGNALLEQLLSDVTLTGTMDVQKQNDGPNWNASLHIQSIAFKGPLPCDTCDELLTFTADVFDFGEVKLELTDADFDFLTEGFDVATFDIDEWTLRPGKFFLFAFLNIVLPAYGIPASVNDYAVELFACNQLISQISFQTITCINKSQNALLDSCNVAKNNMWVVFYESFAAMTAEQHLVTSAQLDMVDTDNDLAAEELSGALTGTFVSAGTDSGSFDFTFDALRD